MLIILEYFSIGSFPVEIGEFKQWILALDLLELQMVKRVEELLRVWYRVYHEIKIWEAAKRHD